jgi:hypothetical protein
VPDTSNRSPVRPAGRITPVVEVTAGALAAVVFGIASALRRGRAFHPDGVAFRATLVVPGGDLGVPLLDEPGRHRALVRFSRGAGLPERFPDLLGIAVRVLDAHGPGDDQDLLFTSSGSAPGLRHVLSPACSFDHGRYSSILPYEVGNERVVFGARPVRRGGPPATRLAELAAAVADGHLRFALDIAEASGPWREVASVEVGEPLPADEAESLRFTPVHTGGGIRPVGVLQSVRRLAYRSSQATRPTPAD